MHDSRADVIVLVFGNVLLLREDDLRMHMGARTETKIREMPDKRRGKQL